MQCTLPAVYLGVAPCQHTMHSSRSLCCQSTGTCMEEHVYRSHNRDSYGYPDREWFALIKPNYCRRVPVACRSSHSASPEVVWSRRFPTGTLAARDSALACDYVSHSNFTFSCWPIKCGEVLLAKIRVSTKCEQQLPAQSTKSSKNTLAHTIRDVTSPQYGKIGGRP